MVVDQMRMMLVLLRGYGAANWHLGNLRTLSHDTELL